MTCTIKCRLSCGSNFPLLLRRWDCPIRKLQDVEAALSPWSFIRGFLSIHSWQLSTVTQPDGYTWLSEPVVKVRFFTVPIKPRGGPAPCKPTKKCFSQSSTNKWGKPVMSKSLLMKPLWSKLQDPILIAKDPPVWLRLSPHEVYLSPLKGVDGAIVGSVGVKSVVETFFIRPSAKPEIRFTARNQNPH
jgi:hypothetical protein